MSTDQVGHIAAESDEDRRKRDQLSKQFEVLSKGSDFCKRFVGMKLMGEVWPHRFLCLSSLGEQ